MSYRTLHREGVGIQNPSRNVTVRLNKNTFLTGWYLLNLTITNNIRTCNKEEES